MTCGMWPRREKGKRLVSGLSKKLPLARWGVLGPVLPEASLWGARRLTGQLSRYSKAHPRGPLTGTGASQRGLLWTHGLLRSKGSALGSHSPAFAERVRLLV